MKRLIGLFIVFAAMLVAGVAANLIVTWWIALRSEPIPAPSTEMLWSHSDGECWYFRIADGAVRSRIDAIAMSDWAAMGRSPDVVHDAPGWSALRERPDPNRLNERIIEHAFGWPMRCMSYRLTPPPAGGPRNMTSATVGTSDWPGFVARWARAQPVGGARSMDNLRPTRIGVGGFVVNTLTYAGALAMLWIVLIQCPRAARRVMRTRKGRCPACGYDLRSAFDEGCSECGWGRRGK